MAPGSWCIIYRQLCLGRRGRGIVGLYVPYQHHQLSYQVHILQFDTHALKVLNRLAIQQCAATYCILENCFKVCQIKNLSVIASWETCILLVRAPVLQLPGLYTGAQLADKHNFIQSREGKISQISHCFTLIIYHKVLTGPTCK